MLRIALLSDVHGNLSALDAVLADIGAAAVDEAYCLGDLVGYGPRPAGAISRVRGLGLATVRGNYDDGVGNHRGDCGCYYATEQARKDGEASYVFTDAALDDADHAWLAGLPDRIRFEVDGVRLLLTHGSPRKLNEYLQPDRPDDLLAKLADQAEADVVCIGHVHVPYHRRVRGADGRSVHYVSAGSAGKPKDGDPRAAWTEVALGTESEVRELAWEDPASGPVGKGPRWLAARVHRVDYDVEDVAREMRQLGLPPTLAEALLRA